MGAASCAASAAGVGCPKKKVGPDPMGGDFVLVGYRCLRLSLGVSLFTIKGESIPETKSKTVTSWPPAKNTPSHPVCMHCDGAITPKLNEIVLRVNGYVGRPVGAVREHAASLRPQ